MQYQVFFVGMAIFATFRALTKNGGIDAALLSVSPYLPEPVSLYLSEPEKRANVQVGFLVFVVVAVRIYVRLGMNGSTKKPVSKKMPAPAAAKKDTPPAQVERPASLSGLKTTKRSSKAKR
jgi:hypothetical protein